MTVSLNDLASLIASLPKATPMPITPAFITESAFSVGDQAFPAVVTAGYLNREAGTFEITFDVLNYTGPAPISLTIDQADIRAVREMLGIGRNLPFTYNEMLTQRRRDDLATAIEDLEELEEIAFVLEGRPLSDQYMTAREIAEKCINLAKAALTKIADPESIQ